MLRNEGTPDRIIRAAVLAPVLAILAWVVGIGTTFGIILGVLAVVMLVTGLVGFCPLYRVFGMNTCPAGVKKT